ncbi:uncharacterized protein LOC128256896 [Drosophila gunungcola]|uniref:Uncharacterized protein n=1 Tax=Drosophila gunungcola TaxID=103775 RepID=A0A9Q0BLF6_9MUSC|nr:uncharacterized protein LOC128256896 [Drosophila gunungcola]KAI8035749.1 hypothetical protein M5D96_011499 [Drosophila gunungcola]
MIWSTLIRGVSLRQGSSSSSSKPPKPPSPPNSPKQPSDKKESELRTFCQPAAFCAEADRFKSMWDPPKNLPPPYPFVVARSNELCCGPNCTKPLPSFDELYYRPSSKAGPFQRHWVECPKFMIRQKKICAYDKLETLDPARRVAKRRERTTLSPAATGPCPHFAPLARCVPGRRPPRCHAAKTPSCCRRLCCPMPCWSDCKQPVLAKRPHRPKECECRFALSLCEAERGRQWVKIHGENHICPSAVKKAKKARKAMLKKKKDSLKNAKRDSRKKKDSPKKDEVNKNKDSPKKGKDSSTKDEDKK